MARHPALGKYLEWQGNTIRVVVAVPVGLQRLIGKTKLKASLGTDSPARAETLKWAVIAKLKAELDGVAKVADNPLIREALEWKAQIATARRPEGPDDDDDEVGLMTGLLHDRAEELEKSQGYAVARSFVDVAAGHATPLQAHLETFLAEQKLSPRYKDDIRRAVKRLATWCARGGSAETLQAMTRRVAGDFISRELATVLGDRKTMNKDISALSSYWKWLGKRGHLGDDRVNPWVGQSFDVERSPGLAEESGERAFTEEEAATLLYGPATPRMRDIMWIAAFTGMRIDEVCRLQVGDCEAGWFAINARRATTGEGKTKAARRDVPIHSALEAIIARCTKNKKPDALLINGLPAPDPSGRRKPSAAAGQEFTRYRRSRGVDERVEGKRRALVNFHSWRRRVATLALRAGHPLHMVSALIGHEDGRKGVTIESYFRDGPSGAQFQAMVASIEVPPPPKSNAKTTSSRVQPGGGTTRATLANPKKDD